MKMHSSENLKSAMNPPQNLLPLYPKKMYKPVLNRVKKILNITTLFIMTTTTIMLSPNLHAENETKSTSFQQQPQIANWQVLSETIKKSPADNREYQAIRLANGLTALLVSDPEATLSLGALALPIGSLDDPDSQQGLAHYLEHMVLMGSKKYPEPSGFSEFLKKHGGSHNASTASFRTSFYFEVNDKGLPEALDRLADAIAEPLLDPTFADKERNAVNAELTLARSRDGMRMGQVTSETINPEHPSAKFFGGNLETLSDKPQSKLQEALTTFYQTYYSANYMVGIIYSARPLSELADLAENAFGRIANKQANVPKITTPVVTEKEQGIIIHYVPVQPLKQLKLEFRIPETTIDPNNREFLEKTDTLIGYLIGNRSENTLASWLQDEGYIEDIGAGAYLEQDRNGGVFTIAANLTDKGIANRDTVIAAIFNYLDLIKQQGIEARYFDEMKNVLNIDFRFQSITRDMGYVEQLADNMLTRPIENVLDADYATSEFNPSAVKARLAMLTPENARIWFISPDEPHNKTAYFVEAPYQVEKIAAQRFADWETQSQSFKFTLPELNPYIPTDFSLIKEMNLLPGETEALKSKNNESSRPIFLPAEFLSSIIEEPELASAPIRAYQKATTYSNLMFQPKASINLVLREPLSSVISKNTPDIEMKKQISLALIDYLAGLQLKQLTYQASVAGIEFSTGFDNGLALNASGYTQNLPKLLVEVLKAYQAIKPTEAQFEQAKSWYLNQLLSADRVKPFELAIQPLQTVSRVPYFERDERRAMLAKLSLDDVMVFHQNLFKESQLDILSVGNISRQQIAALAFALKVANIWHYTPVSKIENVENQFAKFNFGENVLIVQPEAISLNRQGESSDSALAALYIPLNKVKDQANQQSNESRKQLIKQQALAIQLSDILQPWFYDELRTNQQLGYAVFTFPYSIGKQWGVLFLLQSNVKQPAALYEQYKAFYSQANTELAKLSEQEFADYQRGTIAKLEEPPQTIEDEASRFLDDFSNGNAAFESREELIASLKALKLEDIRAFYQTAIFGENTFTGISQVSGSEQDTDFAKAKEFKLLENSSSLQKRFSIQPIVPTQPNQSVE